MIKSCFLSVEQRIIGDYFNSETQSELFNRQKSLQQFLSSKLEYNVLTKHHSPHLGLDLFYFCFYHHETFTLIFEVVNNRPDIKDILFSISQDLKKFTIQNYYSELQKGSVNSVFTYHLRTLLAQYESVASRVKTIDKIRQGLQDLKLQAQENFNKIIERGNDIEVMTDQTEIIKSLSDDMVDHSQKLRKKVWWQQMKRYLLLGLFFAIVIAVFIWGIFF